MHAHNSTIILYQATEMTVPNEITQLGDDQALTFLEFLAHNLTISVRMAASDKQPQGCLNEEQTRLAMYWINEALHNVVQLTRDLRLKRASWRDDETWKWIDLWLGYAHASKYIGWAVERSIEETSD